MGWIFGAERMFEIIEDMIRSRPNYIFMLCWKYLTLVSLIGVLFILWWSTSPSLLTAGVYPDWTNTLCWLLALSSILLVPARCAGKGSLKQRWRHLGIPDPNLPLTCKQ